MNIAEIDENTFDDLLEQLHLEADWSTEVRSIRPVSMAKRGENIKGEVDDEAKAIGGEIVGSGNSQTLRRSLRKKYFLDFVIRLVTELYKPVHDIICSKKFQSTALETSLAGAQIAALTQLLVDYLNISAIAALGIATAIVLAVIRSMQGTFCMFSENEVLSRLENLKQ